MANPQSPTPTLNVSGTGYPIAFSGQVIPIALPGTLPSPGTLTSGQSASWAVTSAGGGLQLVVPITGSGTLEVSVDGTVVGTISAP